MSEKSFDMWALVELFGHQKIAGRVSEQVIAGTGFVRVDVPETGKQAGHTRFYNPTAVYGITPVDENVARAIVETIYIPEIVPISLRHQLEAGEDDEL
jgi:hypothetical protein